jgi:hypothetical protein
MSRRVKILNVSPEYLVTLLQQDGTRRVRIEGMPADAKIVNVSDQYKFNCGWISFMVESDTFPEVKDGRAIPEMDPLSATVFFDETGVTDSPIYSTLIQGRGM